MKWVVEVWSWGEGAQPGAPRPLDDSAASRVDMKNFMVILEDKRGGLTSAALIKTS